MENTFDGYSDRPDFHQKRPARSRMTSQSRDEELLQQLEKDYSDENSAIELVIRDVKIKFSTFQNELSQRQSEILDELSNIRQRVYETYTMKKKSLFDVYQNSDMLLEQNLSTHVRVSWKNGGLGLGDLCEIRTTKEPKSIPKPQTTEPYGDLIKSLYKIRLSQSLLNAIDMEYPSEMYSTARRLISNKEYKFPILDMYEFIQHNLKNNRTISDIQDAIYYISKYAICLFYDPNRSIFHTINTQTSYHIDNISSKVVNFDLITRKMDFVFNHSTQCYTINYHNLPAPQYIDKLAGICCELLLAFEELTYFRDKKNIDPISYFVRQVSHSGELQSVCPITDLIDSCALHRDASISSQSSFHSSPNQSINYQHRDTPNSSLSDTPYCSGETFQPQTNTTHKDLHENDPHESILYRRGSEVLRCQAFNNSSKDLHGAIPLVQTPIKSPPKQDLFVTAAFDRGFEESNLYSISDSINDHLLQSVMLPKVDSSFDVQYKPCPNCNKANRISYHVCNWCRKNMH